MAATDRKSIEEEVSLVFHRVTTAVDSPPAVGLVRRTQARSAVASFARSLPSVDQRDHAAADTGGDCRRIFQTLHRVRFPMYAYSRRPQEVEVLRLWEGLGYYRRARQLHAAAKQIVAVRGGTFPAEPNELQQLPGIGRYTAGAIASIAFDKRAPILEANTIRLLSRLIAFRGNPHLVAGQRPLWQVAEEILPQKNVAEFNQGLMELGSLVCTPSEPKCAECPLSTICAAHAAGLQHEIPLAKPRTVYTELREAAVIIRKNGSVLVRQCATDERWAGLWDFPRFAVKADGPLFVRKEIASKVESQTGITCAPGGILKTMKHGVTRYRITLDCYQAAYVCGRVRGTKEVAVRWLPIAALPALPLSTTGRKIANLISEK